MTALYQCTLTFTGPVLGTTPTNAQIFTDYVVAKAIENGVNGVADEWDTAPTSLDIDRDLRGLTGFHRDNRGQPSLVNYQIRGYFKEAAKHLRRDTSSLSHAMKAYSQVITGQVFVNGPGDNPKIIPFKLSGPITVLERPLRASTPQGERVSLTSSQCIPAGSSLSFQIKVLADKVVTEKHLREWLDYGENLGLQQWRSSSYYGTFQYELERIA